MLDVSLRIYIYDNGGGKFVACENCEEKNKKRKTQIGRRDRLYRK